MEKYKFKKYDRIITNDTGEKGKIIGTSVGGVVFVVLLDNKDDSRIMSIDHFKIDRNYKLDKILKDI